MWLAGTGRVSKVEEFEVANVESLWLGRDADKIACVVDPAGFFWEVLERHQRNVTEALCKVYVVLVIHLYRKPFVLSARMAHTHALGPMSEYDLLHCCRCFAVKAVSSCRKLTVQLASCF